MFLKKNILYLHPQSGIDFDSIAQLVEHNTFNVGVLGSSPSRVTKILKNTILTIAKTR